MIELEESCQHIALEIDPKVAGRLFLLFVIILTVQPAVRSQASQKDSDPNDFRKGAWMSMLEALDLPLNGLLRNQRLFPHLCQASLPTTR